MSTGFVTFVLGGRVFATALDDVREIVRLTGLEALPGMVGPLAGVILMRGAALPVFDLRAANAAPEAGDVLVVHRRGEQPVGIAVDAAQAVLQPGELVDPSPVSQALPPYVVEVRRGEHGPVLMVELQALLSTLAAGWQGAVPTGV